jgi:hypothetical protein
VVAFHNNFATGGMGGGRCIPPPCVYRGDEAKRIYWESKTSRLRTSSLIHSLLTSQPNIPFIQLPSADTYTQSQRLVMLGSVSPCSLTTQGSILFVLKGKVPVNLSVNCQPAILPALANLPIRELIISQFNNYLYIKDQELN